MAFNSNQSEFGKYEEFFLEDETDSYSDCVIVPNGEILCDRFIINELIQANNQSTVYLANDTLNDMDVIIKTVDIGSHREKIPGILLKLEMDIYKNLFSPNIIKIYDLHYANIDGTTLLILSMEHFNGQTFHQWLSGSNSNAHREKGLNWFKKICHAIGEAHDKGIIHLNINPENMLIKNTQLKVTGFETSNFARIKLVNQGLSLDALSTESDPVYMSPELFNIPHPDELTPAADIYSLGILLYELFHPKYRTPFTGTYSDLRDCHINVPFKEIENIDKKVSDIIARCLEKNPQQRYQNAWELLDVLESKQPQNIQDVEGYSQPPLENNGTSFQEILQSYEKKNFNKTIQLIDAILFQEPGHSKALQLQTRLTRKNNQVEILYDEIKQGLKSEKKSLKLLLMLFKQATDIYPDHPSSAVVQHKLFNMSQLYKTSIKQGINAFQNQNWSEALHFFKHAHKIEAGSGVFKIKIEKLQKIKYLRNEIDDNIAKGDLKKARRLAHLTDFIIKQIKHSNTWSTWGNNEN